MRRSLSITDLCEHYGISRKSGYERFERYENENPATLAARLSRRDSVFARWTPTRSSLSAIALS